MPIIDDTNKIHNYNYISGEKSRRRSTSIQSGCRVSPSWALTYVSLICIYYWLTVLTLSFQDFSLPPLILHDQYCTINIFYIPSNLFNNLLSFRFVLTNSTNCAFTLRFIIYLRCIWSWQFTFLILVGYFTGRVIEIGYEFDKLISL